MKYLLLVITLLLSIGCVQEVVPIEEDLETPPVTEAPKPTPPETVPSVELQISDIQLTELKESSVKISWKTNLAASSQVDFGTTSSLGIISSSLSLITNHQRVLSNLKDDTTYYFRVKSIKDKEVSSNILSFKTLKKVITPVPVVLPKITNSTQEIDETSISIYWELDQGATGQLEYGETSALGNLTTKENNYLTVHRQVIRNLKPATTYYYKIISANKDGKVALYETKSFKTDSMPVPAPVITNRVEDNIGQTSAQVYWELDQSSTGQIEYGTTTALGTFSGKENNYLDAHRQTLSNLTEGTTYYYKIISTNIDGRTVTSSVNSFKTLDKVVVAGGDNTSGKCYPKSEVRQNNNYIFHGLGYNPPPYPAYLKPIKEPNFGNYVTRITGKEVYGFVNRRLRHDYSKTQSWNSDGTLLSSSGSGGARRIFDGKTFKILGDANLSRWSYTQPYVTYGTGDNELRSRILDPKTMKVTFKTVKKFSNYSKVSLPTAEDNWSSDDRIFALQARKPGSSDFWIVVYDRIQDKILGERNMKINFDASYSQKEIDSVAASQSGKYIVVQGKRAFPSYTGVHVYDLQMNFLRKVTNDGMHADLCIDADGDDVYVAVNEVVSYKLKNGARRMNAKGLLFNGHLSCRNIKRPGWAYTTTNIFLNNQYGKEKAPGQGEIIAVKLDGSNTIQRFTKFYTQKKDYNHEVQGTVNHDGTRVLFASNWRESDIVKDAYPPMFVAEAICD